MRELFDGIPLGEMNTAMTINATAMWLLALYQTVAEEQGATADQLQNFDAERHHQGIPVAGHLFPPGPSLRLITDMVAYTVNTIPKWNPINICSYHLQEAGATPVQEIAYANVRRLPCWMRCVIPARSQRIASERSSRGSRSS